MTDRALQDANALMMHGRRREALAQYETYLAAHPESAEAWHNRGVTLSQMKRFEDAASCFEQALTLRPDSAQSWSNRATALLELKRHDEACGDYEKALALDPEAPLVRGYYVLAKLWCCDWDGVEAEKAKIAAALRVGQAAIQPFGNLLISTDPADQLACARAWMARSAATRPTPFWRGERYGHDKIRIAYLSGDFREHAVAFLMAGVFEHHDRSRFETIGVSFGPDDKSALRARLAAGFEHFIDARAMSDSAIASRLREMEVDIAVDLMGLTGDCRNGILAFRPAPVQVSYLGFPGTMAAADMDYIIADRTVLPEEHKRHYTENVVYLPYTYFASDSKRDVAERAPGRAEAGLPEKAFVFCSFNNSYKFSPSMFDVWMRILRKAEGAVLWLPDAGEVSCRNLRREAASRGIAPERLIFARHVPSNADHLARLGLADLFLDTLPCNAHTTASDALWTGVPVLTCPGPTFAGRVAASLLKAVGLPELIAPSLEDYENLAVHLAQGRDAHSALKAKLAKNKDSQPLFGTARFTRNLESAFQTMWERSHHGLPPAGFAVGEPGPSLSP